MKGEYIITIDGHPDINGGYAVSKIVELIRCKDCKYFCGVNHYCRARFGHARKLVKSIDWFCADGEKGEQDDKT